MDENPFLQFLPSDSNSDWMICYDYRSLEFDESLVKAYGHITLVAWSMGVWAASQVIKQHPTLHISKCIAINGTLFPIDETKGITPTIFEGTLQGLNEVTLQKFQRRMCCSSTDYRAFQTIIPQRSVEELAEELASIQRQVSTYSPASFFWDIAYIGLQDRIFLSENQREAWRTSAHSIKEVNAAHYQYDLFKEIFSTIETTYE